MSDLDLQQFSVRTDLALEAKEIAEQGAWPFLVSRLLQ